MDKKRLSLVVGFLFLLAVATTFSLTLTSVTITPVSPSSNDNLRCSYTASSYTTINISWYNGSVLFSSALDVADLYVADTQTSYGDVWNCTVIASNSTANITMSSVVTIGNTPPPQPNIISQSFYEDSSSGSINIAVTDDDGDVLAYSVIVPSDPTFETLLESGLNPSSGVLSFTPTVTHLAGQSVSKSYNVTFIADDGIVGTSKSVTFTVYAVNDAPTFTSTCPSSVDQYAMYSCDVEWSDEENNGPYTFDINDTQFIKNQLGGAYYRINRTFSTPGNYSFKMNATDQALATGNTTFTVEVLRVNNNPYFYSIANQTATQDQSLYVVINASDPDNDTIYFLNGTRYDITVNHTQVIGGINYTFAVLNFTPNNDDVGNITLNLTAKDVYDGTNFTLLNVEVLNVNDAPSIEAIVPDSVGINLPFSYTFNGTDPDLDYGDVLTYSVNATYLYDSSASLVGAFTLNSATGLFELTPNSSHIGNHSINVTVTDSFGLTASTLMNITVLDNTFPVLMSFGSYVVNESEEFYLLIDVTDPGDVISFTINGTLLTIVNITSNQSEINFTPSEWDVGNYSFRVIATDALGASDIGYFNLTVNNINDAPVFSNLSQTMPNFVEGFLSTYRVNVTDWDLVHNQGGSLVENLTISNNWSLVDITFYSIVNETWFVDISFQPNSSHIGNHTINFTVTDLYGANDSQLVTFEVFNRSRGPNITTVYPYQANLAVQAFTTAQAQGNSPITLNTTENRTIAFTHTSVSLDGYALSYRWYRNGTLVSSTASYNWNMGFTSAGSYFLQLYVEDEFFASQTFNWTVKINNINRRPVFSGTFDNVTMAEDSIYAIGSGAGLTLYFTDPDGDILTYSAIQDSNLRIVPDNATGAVTFTSLNDYNYESGGLLYSIFTASDGYLTAQSNNFSINITPVDEIPPQQVESPSSSRTRNVDVPVIIPFDNEVEKPVSLEIITPRPLEIYANETIRAPLVIHNKGEDVLKGITLSYETNFTADYGFSKYYFNQLQPGEKQETSLVITNYRELGSFEIKIIATVDDPEYNDSAIIFLNSLEQGKENETNLNTRISFARDLLEENTECKELDTLIEYANTAIKNRQYTQAEEYIDQFLENCRFLISNNEDFLSGQQSAWIDITPTLLFNGSIILVSMFVILGLIVYSMQKVNK